MLYKREEKIIHYCDKTMEFSLYLMVFFLPISKAIIEITSTLAIIAFLIKKITQKQFPSTYLNLPLFAFVGISALSIIGTSSLHTSLRNFFSKLIEQVFLFFIVFETINTRQKIKNILLVMFSSAFLVGIDGIFQYFTHKDFLRYRTMPFKNRINAPFYTPNDLGAYLVPLTILSLSANFLYFKNRVIRVLMRIVPVLLFSNLILTFSRGAWLGLIVGLIFMASIVLFLKNKKTLLIPSLLIILIIIVFLPLRSDIPLSKILDFTDAGSVDRKGLWIIAWNMIKAKPILGHGIGTFMHNFKYYNNIGYSHSVSYAHNCYLQMAAEIGIIGLLAFLWLIVILFKNFIKIIKNNRTKLDPIFLGLISGLLAFLVHSSVETNLYSLDLGALFWIILGLTVSASAHYQT